MPSLKYSDAQLVRAVILDLVSDIRCAERDGLPEYAAECRASLRRALAARHNPKIGRYGWPEGV